MCASQTGYKDPKENTTGKVSTPTELLLHWRDTENEQTKQIQVVVK